MAGSNCLREFLAQYHCKGEIYIKIYNVSHMSLKNLEDGCETNPQHEILWPKMRFELKPHLFCFFGKCVSRETVLLLDFTPKTALFCAQFQ